MSIDYNAIVQSGTMPANAHDVLIALLGSTNAQLGESAFHLLGALVSQITRQQTDAAHITMLQTRIAALEAHDSITPDPSTVF